MTFYLHHFEGSCSAETNHRVRQLITITDWDRLRLCSWLRRMIMSSSRDLLGKGLNYALCCDVIVNTWSKRNPMTIRLCVWHHDSDTKCALWRLKSPVTRLFIQQLIQAKTTKKKTQCSPNTVGVGVGVQVYSHQKRSVMRKAFTCLDRNVTVFLNHIYASITHDSE